MPMMLTTDRFRGNLIEMLGRDSSDAVRGLAPPRRIVEGGGRERLEWEEIVEDSESGRRFPIFPTAGLMNGRVIEVGIRADDMLFILDFNGNGEPFFAAVTKRPEFSASEMNWVRKGQGGNQYFNSGVE